MMRGWTLGLALAAGLAGAAQAECVGRNLLDDLPPDTRAAIDAAAAAQPYHQGLLWQATKGDARMVLVGTYHLDDPRHDSLMARIAPELTAADALLVEAGPDEEAQLTRAMGERPDLLIDTTGPTLPERLTAEEWATLSAALSDRGLPPVIASKMRPWYVATMLGVSPCLMRDIAAAGGKVNGLDRRMMAAAKAADVPVKALEPWDTAFKIFSGMSEEEQIDMLRTALPAAAHADDYGVTLADAYFAGDVWTVWEFGRFDAYDRSGLSKVEVDAQMELAQTRLMDERNRAWIAPLTAAAATAADKGKAVVAGFGALHLPGQAGVLHLLEQDGWTITPLPGG